MSAEEIARLHILNEAPLDSWIALAEDESKIVAIGDTYAEAVQNSEKAGVAEPVLIKTPEKWGSFSVKLPD